MEGEAEVNEQEEFEFRLRLEKEQSQATPKDTPETAPLPTFKERLARTGMAFIKGAPAGPLGAIASVTAEGVNQANQGMDRLAYNAGGAVTDALAGKVPPEVAGGAGYVANLGTQMIPMIAGMATGKAAQPALKDVSRNLMQRAVKPSAAHLKSGQAERAIETMLDRGISPTSGAMEATKARVDILESKLQKVLEKSPSVVDKAEVTKGVEKAIEDVRYNLDRVQNVKDIKDAVAKFMNHPELQEDKIPVAVANKLKQAFYKEVGGKAYLPGQSITPFDMAEKGLASGLKSNIAQEVPEVIPTLKEQSDLINVLKVVGHKASAEGNKNLLGLTMFSPTEAKALIWMADRYPWIKGTLARLGYSVVAPSAPVVGAAAGAAVGAQSGK